MRYFATASSARIRAAMREGLLGMIATPLAGNKVVDGIEWCGDNNAFGGDYPGDPAFLTWIYRRHQYAPRCRFIVAPDVVGDAFATLERSAPMLPVIRSMDFPVALVAQNGLEDLVVPWSSFDALFIGGDTQWKVGPAAAALAAEARARGKWVHMGRVNSLKRLRLARHMGCDSADGTLLAHGPDRHLDPLLRWLREVNADDQTVLL
jgi:hypothetical protein